MRGWGRVQRLSKTELTGARKVRKACKLHLFIYQEIDTGWEKQWIKSNMYCFLYFLWFWKWFPAEERFPPHGGGKWAWWHCHCCYYYRPSYLEHFLPVWAIVHRRYLSLLINLALFNLKKKDKPIPPLLTIDLKPAALIARCLCNNVLVWAVALYWLAFQAPAEDL